MAKKEFPVSLLSKMYSDSKFSDVTFQVEKEVFKVHKAVLGYSCPYFEVLLYGNTNEASQNVITLKGTSARAFKCVIDYIYTGNINTSALNDNGYCLEVIALSHEYQFDGLLSKLMEDIPWRTKHCSFLFRVLEMASKYECYALKEICMKFIDYKGNEIISAKNEFASLSLNVVNEIILRDTFVVKEIDLFNCLMHWKKNHIDVDITNCLRNIRLGLINHVDFVQYIEPLSVYDFETYLLAMRRKKVRSRRGSGESTFASNAVVIKNGKSFNFPCRESYILDSKDLLCIKLHEEINDAREIRFNLDDTAFFGDLTFQVKSERDIEYNIASSIKSELRFGRQFLRIKPQKVKYILVKCSALVKFSSLNFDCSSDCTKSFDVNDGHLIGCLATAKIMDLSFGDQLPHPKYYNLGPSDNYALFAFPQPSYYKSLIFEGDSVMKIPRAIFVKGKRSEGWRKIEFKREGINNITFKICLVSLILLVGTDLHIVQFKAV